MSNQPPKRALSFLRWFCREDYLEEIEGDLIEVFEKQFEVSPAKARQSFRWNVLKSFRWRNLKSANRYKHLINPDMLQHYFLVAFRQFNKNRSGSLINLVGLTLGLSACLVIYLITSFELKYDTFHPEKNRIYRVVGDMHFGEGNPSPVGFVPYALPEAMRQEVSGLETVAAFHNAEGDVKIPNGNLPAKVFERRNMETEPAEIIIAEPQYFEIFQYEWLAGNPKSALNEPHQVVLSEKKAYKYFGRLLPEEILGKEVIYMDSLRMTVTGIVRDWEEPTDFSFTDFLSFSTISHSFVKNYTNLNEWNDLWSASQAFVKLNKKTSPAQIEAQFTSFSKAHFTGDFHFRPDLQPLSSLHFDTEYTDNYSRKAHLPTLFGLMGLAVFILIIAAINFINLTTAQSFRRAKEVGIRKVLGSDRKSLVSQFLIETFILTTASIMFSLMLVPYILSLFQSYIPVGVSLNYDWKTWAFLLTVTFTTVFLAGFYPSFVLSSHLPALTLKGQIFQREGHKGYIRKGLIVFQFTVSLVLILGTLLVGEQIRFMRHKDLGFQSDAVIVINLPRNDAGKKSILYEKIQQLPGVKKAALQIFEPMGVNFGLDKVIYPEKPEEKFDVAYKMGDENFIPFYEMKLLAGRNVHKSDTAKEFVITESFVKMLGLQQASAAIGIQLQWQGKYYPVVGVIGDFHQQSMHEKIPPTFITTAPWANNIAVKLADKTADKSLATISQIEQFWKEIYPDKKFEYSYFDETIARFYEKEQKTERLINVATFVALLISCLGLYGLSAFTLARRTKEIGIRKVLGASVSGIMVLLSKEYLGLVILSFLIAFPVSWYLMSQWLLDFAYRVDIQWWIFVLAMGITLIITFLTVSFQSARAALANPVESLRNE